MTGFELEHFSWFVMGLWASIGFAVLILVFEFVQRDRSARFVSSIMFTRLATATSRKMLVTRAVIMALTGVLAFTALARPSIPGQGQREQTVQTADVAVVLDVSRSMLADDAAPTRLERAKAGIFQIVKELKNSRVALIAFAGEASMQCALTSNHDFFRIALRAAGPQNVSYGGTNLSAALKAGIESLDRAIGTKIMVLITDGEDHESDPLAMAELARKEKVHVITVGFGSEDGSQISIVDPVTKAKTVLRDSQGLPVISKLDGELLRQIAEKTEGAYVPAGVSAVQMDAIVEQHIQPLLAAETIKAKENRLDLSAWFILLSFIAYIIVMITYLLPRRPL